MTAWERRRGPARRGAAATYPGRAGRLSPARSALAPLPPGQAPSARGRPVPGGAVCLGGHGERDGRHGYLRRLCSAGLLLSQLVPTLCFWVRLVLPGAEVPVCRAQAPASFQPRQPGRRRVNSSLAESRPPDWGGSDPPDPQLPANLSYPKQAVAIGAQ